MLAESAERELDRILLIIIIIIITIITIITIMIILILILIIIIIIIIHKILENQIGVFEKRLAGLITKERILCQGDWCFDAKYV